MTKMKNDYVTPSLPFLSFSFYAEVTFMATNIVSETYLVIAAVIAASILGGAMAFGTTTMSDSMRAAWLDASERSKVMVEAIFAFGSSSDNVAYVFVKNIGKRPLYDSEIKLSDVFFGQRGAFERIPYAESGTGPRWTYNIVNDDGDSVWEPGETIQISVILVNNLGPGDYYFRFVTPFGRYTEILFTAG